MAMLAERKRKVKWALNPRGKQWSEDSNKFGQKMLEKMGWTNGKGLGVNESGITEHIKVSFKNDSQGIGYKQRDDQWTQHEDQFNSLLNSLNGSSDNKKENDEPSSGAGLGFKEKENTLTISEVLSGESLEDKSKKSKARVHYKKFTRGKDISKYSEKDLANIFGKKVDDLKNRRDLTNSDVTEQEINSTQESKKNDLTFGITTMESKLSIADYFKSKLPNKKANKYIVGSDGVLKSAKDEVQSEDDLLNNFRPSFCLDQKDEQNKLDGCNLKNEHVPKGSFSNNICESFEIDEKPKMTKLQNNVPYNENMDQDSIVQTNAYIEENSYKLPKKMKRKHQDNGQEISEKLHLEVSDTTERINDEDISKSKKKKRKSKEEPLDNDYQEENTADLELVKKKKKTKKNDNEMSTENNDLENKNCDKLDESNNNDSFNKKSKKKKKSKKCDVTQEILEDNRTEVSTVNETSLEKKNFNIESKRENNFEELLVKESTKNRKTETEDNEEVSRFLSKLEPNTNSIDNGNDKNYNISSKKKKRKVKNQDENMIINENNQEIEQSSETRVESIHESQSSKVDNENTNENGEDCNTSSTKKRQKNKNQNENTQQSENKSEKETLESQMEEDNKVQKKKFANYRYAHNKKKWQPKGNFGDRNQFEKRMAERLERKKLKEKLKKEQEEKGSFISKNAFSGSNFLKLPGYY